LTGQGTVWLTGPCTSAEQVVARPGRTRAVGVSTQPSGPETGRFG